MITLNVNGKPRDIDVAEDMPLLWTLRDVLSMTVTKLGCAAHARFTSTDSRRDR